MPGVINWGSSPTPSSTGSYSSGRINWGGVAAATAVKQKAATQPVVNSFQNEQNQLRQQQQAKGINNPASLVSLQAQLHNKQITPQQFTQQFAKASKGATGANNTNMTTPTPFKVTPASVASSAGTAIADLSGERPVAKVLARVLPGGQNDLKAENQATNSNISSQQFINGLQQSGKITPTQAARIQKQAQLNQALNARNIQKTATSIPSRTQVIDTGAAKLAGQTAQGITRTLPEVTGSVKQLVTGTAPTMTPTPASNFLFGKAPVKTIQQDVKGAEASHPAGFHIPGTPVTLTPKETGAAEGVNRLAQDVPVLGGVAKGITELGEKGAGAVAAAAGKDQGVNDLINNTRTQSAQDLIKNTAQKAQTRSNLGGAVIKEANTTHIPVVSPTEANAARTSVGSTAVNNADRTSIPVTGKSTQVVGKSATIDTATYTKQSQQLSKAYDKEVSALKEQPPVVQKIMQGHIDNKYQALQQNLDESAGRTNVSFNSKPTTIPEPKANKVPSPAEDTAPKTRPVSVGTGAGESAGRASAGESTASSVSDKPPTTETAPGTKVSGSALKSESRAVQAGLVKDLGDKATYDTGSYKTEAAKAVDLAHNDPETAKAIAMGQKPGDNTIHEVAVRHAVEQKAIKEGDTQTLLDLSKSTQHTVTSESAQRLGAEGYNTGSTSPVAKIAEVNNARKVAFEKRTGTTVDKATSNDIKAIRNATPKVSIKTWSDFVESLKC